MITPAPAKAQIFNENYDILGEYVQDDSRIPYFNPADSDMLIEPGEPVAVQWRGALHVMQAQGPIFPGEIGMLVRYFTADLPANFSADVINGEEVAWNQTAKKLIKPADISTDAGFHIGAAIWHIDPLIVSQPPAVDGNGRVIVATSDDSKARIICSPGEKTVLGSPTILSA